MSGGPFTLRQLAAAVGVDANSVRVFLRCGLLQPARRRRGREDDVGFHEEHVERLWFIKRALGVGFHLDDIALLVDPAGLITCGDVYALASQRLNEMRRTNEDTHPLEALIQDCQATSQGILIQSCAGKAGRKECQILVRLNHFTPADGK